MKKFSMISVLIVILFIVSCATGQIQVDQESQIAVAKITGRRAGYSLERQYPEISHEVLALSKAILSEEKPDLVRIAIDRVVIVLAAEIDDPLLAADLRDVIALIKIETGIEISDERLKIVKSIAEGLIAGIKIAQQQIKGDKP